MPQENVALVRSAYEAYNRRDPDAVMACFDPDIDWHVPDSLAWGDTSAASRRSGGSSRA